MNSYEEELQKDIEAGNPAKADNADEKAYQEVFRALKTAPATSLSQNFADKIVARVLEKQKRESEKDMFWLGVGIFLMILALVATIMYTGFKFNLGFLKDMSGYTGIFIFGVAFIVLLNWLDKKLVPQKHL